MSYDTPRQYVLCASLENKRELDLCIRAFLFSSSTSVCLQNYVCVIWSLQLVAQMQQVPKFDCMAGNKTSRFSFYFYYFLYSLLFFAWCLLSFLQHLRHRHPLLLLLLLLPLLLTIPLRRWRKEQNGTLQSRRFIIIITINCCAFCYI